ncbi:MAG: ABC-type transport auxiliary lipoprotein family protein [Planctomycetota bacterium]|jgi:cholesterol transport system auxiliary component
MTSKTRKATALLALALLAGCVSQPAPKKLRYVIGPERPGARAEATGDGVLRVERVLVSPIYEHKGFVYRTGEQTLVTDYYNEFFASPGVLVREATGDWLAASGLFESVVSTNVAERADWVLELRVDKLYGDTRGAPRAVVAIEYSLVDLSSIGLETSFRKRYAVERPASSTSAAGIAEAWDEALAEILSSFEADLRAHLAR